MHEWREFNLAALLRRLDAARVEFVVVGGIAAVVIVIAPAHDHGKSSFLDGRGLNISQFIECT